MIELNEKLMDSFGDELQKIANATTTATKAAKGGYSKLKMLRKAAPWLGGAGAFWGVQKVEGDRRLGRRVRMQSGR